MIFVNNGSSKSDANNTLNMYILKHTRGRVVRCFVEGQNNQLILDSCNSLTIFCWSYHEGFQQPDDPAKPWKCLNHWFLIIFWDEIHVALLSDFVYKLIEGLWTMFFSIPDPCHVEIRRNDRNWCFLSIFKLLYAPSIFFWVNSDCMP